MKAWIIALALLPGMAAAQSSREEAWRWCARKDATITLNAQLAGCNWVIRSGLETTESLTGAFYNRGNARAELWDLGGAIADYTEAIRLNPEFLSAFNNRGNARADQGDLNGAIADFSEAIRLNPQNVSAFNNRGFAIWREALGSGYHSGCAATPASILGLRRHDHRAAARRRRVRRAASHP